MVFYIKIINSQSGYHPNETVEQVANVFENISPDLNVCHI